MRKPIVQKFFLLTFLSVLFLFLYTAARNSEYKEGNFLNSFFFIKFCDRTITYRLGQVDSRFNLSSKQALDNMSEAVGIWNKAYKKELFKQDGQGELTVIFSYDERQKLRTEIDKQKSSVDTVESTLEARIFAYESKVADYKRRSAQLNNDIESWNKRGGAPTAVYNNLVKQINNMNAEATSLNAEAQKLNNESRGLGKSVELLNNTVTDFNSLLDIKPEEGLFDPADNTISIYVVAGKDELISTLAHEFGHALGMEHVNDPKSIMYASANSNLKPTLYDMSELDKACRPQSRVEVWKTFLNHLVLSTLSHIPTL